MADVQTEKDTITFTFMLRNEDGDETTRAFTIDNISAGAMANSFASVKSAASAMKSYFTSGVTVDDNDEYQLVRYLIQPTSFEDDMTDEQTSAYETYDLTVTYKHGVETQLDFGS